MATHHLDDTQPHAFWDNTLPARLHIQPGDTVVFETLEASAGHVQPDSPSEVVGHLNFDLIHPLLVESMSKELNQAIPLWSILSASTIKVGARIV